MKNSDEAPHGTKAGWVKRNLLAGLAVVTPLFIPLWVFWIVVNFLDKLLVSFIPEAFHLHAMLSRLTGIDISFQLPGLGLIVTLILLLVMGVMARNIIGRSLLYMGEGILNAIPGVRTVYRAVKQITETITTQNSNAFRRVVMVEYPRTGVWSVAFVSDDAKGQIQATSDKKLLNIFIPTTPNPTSGFLLFVPEEDTIPLDMSVEEALKLVISAGLVTPDVKPDGE